MDRRAIALLTVAIVFSTAAGCAVYRYLDELPAARDREAATVPVVVAADDLTFGTKLENKHLTVARFPKASVPKGAYAMLDSVLGQTSKVFLVVGEPVLASKLSSVGGGLSVMIRPSMRAISLQIDQVTGVSGFVLPGDRVDVLVTIEHAGGANVAVTKTALQNAEVLAAGTTTEDKNKRSITTQVVTLLVDPEGAEAVALGQAQGKMHLVLRNPVDHELVNVRAADTRSVLGIQPEKPARVALDRPMVKAPKDTPPPAPLVVAPPAPAAPEKVEAPTFTIIRDGNITKQDSPAEEKPKP